MDIDIFTKEEFSNEEAKIGLQALKVNPEWNENLKQFFGHLRELGLVYIRKRKDG